MMSDALAASIALCGVGLFWMLTAALVSAFFHDISKPSPRWIRLAHVVGAAFMAPLVFRLVTMAVLS